MKYLKKRQRKTSDIVLAALGVFVLAFVITMTVTFWVFGSVPDTLIQYTLGGGGLEALLLAGIKIAKVVTGKNKEETSDE